MYYYKQSAQQLGPTGVAPPCMDAKPVGLGMGKPSMGKKPGKKPGQGRRVSLLLVKKI